MKEKQPKRSHKVLDPTPLANPLTQREINRGTYSDFVRLLDKKKEKENGGNTPSITSGGSDK